MQRVPRQGVLPLGRKDKALNRQWRERALGKKVRPLPGRPKSKRPTGVSHQVRPELRPKSVLHVSLRVTRRVPNLRSRRRYAVIRNAFVKFCEPKSLGFRLIHFAVLSNHVHFVVEADNKAALSMGMQKLLHSISRRLNALSLREHGESQSTAGGRYSERRGWLGHIFSDRYYAHPLVTPTEMHHAIAYVRNNAARHYDPRALASSGPALPPTTKPLEAFAQRATRAAPDPFSSFADLHPELSAKPKNALLVLICTRYRL